MHRQSFQRVEPVTRADHALGPRDALVTVVVYGDFECPQCKQVAGALKLLLARFKQRVRFVFRHFPLEVIHPYALQAAQIAECASAQGKFWEMHDMLFANQSRLEPARLYEYARTLDLDMARLTAEMNDQTYLRRVREHQRSAEENDVRATPAFFVNGRIQDLSYGVHSLFEAVEATLRNELRARVPGMRTPLQAKRAPAALVRSIQPLVMVPRGCRSSWPFVMVVHEPESAQRHSRESDGDQGVWRRNANVPGRRDAGSVPIDCTWRVLNVVTAFRSWIRKVSRTRMLRRVRH